MSKHYGAIVVGAGSMGMAAGYYLAKQGVHVLLIDQYDPPHDQGSHFGETRIIRHAYGEGRGYVPLALSSQTLWNELEKQSHLKIFTQTGSLGFGSKGKSAFIDEAVTSGKEYELNVTPFTRENFKEKFPGLTLPENYHGFYEPDSGILYSENCLRAYKELAIHYGAEISFNNPVQDINSNQKDVEVISKKGKFTADKLIMSAGPWMHEMSQQVNLELPLQTTRQPIGWFEANENLFNSNTFPTFMGEIPTEKENAIYYGFPSIHQSGLKIGRHDYGEAIHPDAINRQFGFHEDDEAHLREFLNAFMPEAAGALKKGVVCMYTHTPDGHFIIDEHLNDEKIIIAAGFSGHGFKFASAVGEILAELVISGKTSHDISLFKLDRPELKKK